MKLEGFIGAAYTLDSPNVDAQRCVNLYPEVIESGKGKEGQVAYLRGTPGLELFETIGDGPIRCIHVDSIGRVFVVSGAQIYAVTRKALWQYRFDTTVPVAASLTNSDVDTSADTFTSVAHGLYTGLRVRVSSTTTLPAPLAAATDYYVIKVSANVFSLATTLANAIAGTAINITTVGGVGTHTFTPRNYSPITNIKHSEIDFTAGSFRSVDHGLPNGVAVTFKASGTPIVGVTVGTTYYVTGRTDDTFKLASSFANALAGTSLALTDVTDAWLVKAVNSEGLYGTVPVPLSSSSGVVKAASMSLGGTGTDSSTVFIDGVNNYLFKDNLGALTFGYLGDTDSAQVVFNIINDITMYSTTDVADLVANQTFKIRASTGGAVPDVFVDFYKLKSDPNTFRVDIQVGTLAGGFTSAQLVEYITNGSVVGKTVTYNAFINTTTMTAISSFAEWVASGGGSEDVTAAFIYASAPAVAFTLSVLSGTGYGAVPAATDVSWSDGYFILTEGGTNRFRVSDVQSFNLDALSFASSEGSPDLVLAVQVLNRYLYVFNEKSIEVYANTGNVDFPFERIQGGFIEFGLLAAASVAKVGQVLCWLGRTSDGDGTVFSMDGTQPKRISTHAIEQAIRGYADPESAVAWTYQTAGHAFYILNFDEATWAYDLATGLWHERAYLSSGELIRHRAQVGAYIPSTRQHWVGDYLTNKVYILSESTYTDNLLPIQRLRSAPHISSDGNRLSFSRFQLDMEVGIGLDGGVQGSDPTVMLDWSDDGGHTWSSEQYALADSGSGSIGEYSKRVIWRRLGSSRDRIFRVKISDPVKVKLINAMIDAETRGS